MASLFRRTWTCRHALSPRTKTVQLSRPFSGNPIHATAEPAARVTRIESRLPRFLQGYVKPLRDAPVSHITAFLILHELTAIVPLFGLAAAFHYGNWLPPVISEGKWISEYTKKFGNWMRKKGWIDDEERGGRWWGRGEAGVSIVVALATAYAITKLLLPLRLMLSVWGTPWFARWTVLPITSRLPRLFSREKPSPASGPDAARTGAVGGNAVPKVMDKK